MNTLNSVLQDKAKEALQGKWKLAVKVTLVYFLIEFLLRAIPVLGAIASILVSGAFMFGLAVFSLAISRNQEATLSQLFEGFNTWTRTLKAYLRMVITVLLWSLLLIIPGIIASLAYSQLFYILVDDRTITPRDAMKKSKEMMKGYKWKLFCLSLRFLGWALLALLTLGIGFLWLMPYIQVTMAKFYDDIKASTPDVHIVPPVTSQETPQAAV